MKLARYVDGKKKNMALEGIINASNGENENAQILLD